MSKMYVSNFLVSFLLQVTSKVTSPSRENVEPEREFYVTE